MDLMDNIQLNPNLLSEEDQIKWVSIDPTEENWGWYDSIYSIDNPTEPVQLAAITNDWRAIAHIKFPTEKAQILAISKSELAIEHIKHPTDKAKQYHNMLWRI